MSENQTSQAASAPQSGKSIIPIAATSSALTLLGLVLAWVAYSRRYIEHRLPMIGALDGEIKWFDSRGCKVAYYIGGQARRTLSLTSASTPLLMIHSINAAASAYEMKPLYDHYAKDRRVYALDLPGFGFSDRSDRRYGPELLRDAINDFVAKELNGGPVDAIGLSLGGEFLAQAAQAQPKQFRTLAFISPTGMSQNDRVERGNEGVLQFLRMPLLRQPFFDLLTSRPVLQFFLKQNLRRPVNRGLLNYSYISSHQRDAVFAPLYFLAGKLFTASIFETYLMLKQHILLMYGRDSFVGYDRVDELRRLPNWKINAFENTGGLVQWDDPAAVTVLLDKHLT